MQASKVHEPKSPTKCSKFFGGPVLLWFASVGRQLLREWKNAMARRYEYRGEIRIRMAPDYNNHLAGLEIGEGGAAVVDKGRVVSPTP